MLKAWLNPIKLKLIHWHWLPFFHSMYVNWVIFNPNTLTCDRLIILYSIFTSGICNICSKSCDLTCYWGVSSRALQWEHSYMAGCLYSNIRHLVHPSSCTRVAARKVEAGQLGKSNLLGESWPVWGEDLFQIFLLHLMQSYFLFIYTGM